VEAVGWKEGTVGRAVGAVVVTGCDTSRRADCRGRMSSSVSDSVTTIQARSLNLKSSSSFSFSDLRELGVDSVQLGGDGYYARDSGAED